jgi:hypothetical protein
LHKLITIRSYVNDWIHFEYNNRRQGGQHKAVGGEGPDSGEVGNVAFIQRDMRDRNKRPMLHSFKLRRTHCRAYFQAKCDSISITTSFTALVLQIERLSSSNYKKNSISMLLLVCVCGFFLVKVNYSKKRNCIFRAPLTGS